MHRAYDPHPEPRKQPIRWRAIVPWLVVIYIAGGFYSVQPNEQAVVRRCGKVLDRVRGPGLHFGFPWPVDKVVRLKTQESKRIAVRASLSDRELGRSSRPQDAECLTGDRNLILVSATVQYQISDPKAYLLRAADVPSVVKGVVAARLTTLTSAMSVDDILTVKRHAIQTQVKFDAQADLDEYQLGVQLGSVSLAESVAPPQEVVEAFSDVSRARADRQRAIDNARSDQTRLKAMAEGEADGMMRAAEAFSSEVTLMATGDADRFKAVAAELTGNRALTTRRLILETMEVVLPRMKKIVLDATAGESVDLGLIEEGR